jgi:hypothetical protein
MSLDAGPNKPDRGGANQELWPKWMWIAVPVLVVVVVAGLWWAIFTPGNTTRKGPTATPTVRMRAPATQAPTMAATLTGGEAITSTRPVIAAPTMAPTSAPTATVVPTPVPSGLSVGAKAKVVGTAGSGLNIRSAAGTGHARVKTLREGSVVEIIGGPTDADGLTWWQVRDESGVSGWGASKYLAPQQ